MVSLSEPPKPLKSKQLSKTENLHIQYLQRSVFGELKILHRTSLASLEAGKRPFYLFWQLF